MTLEDAKVWLYRVQQRLAITRREAAALLVLSGLLGAGLVARHVQGHPQAVPGSERALSDPRFREGAARLRAGATAQGALATEETRAETGEASTPGDSGRIDVNAAPEARLQRLPGVGPVIAERIAAHREAHGPFAEAGDLQRVSGIGPKTMAWLAPLVTVAAPGSTATDAHVSSRGAPSP